MKKILLTLMIAILSYGMIQAQNVKIIANYNVPAASQDSVLSGLISIRGLNYAKNLFGDGQNAIAVTNYNYHTVQVFGVVGNDSLELKWSSPTNIGGSGSSPRYVVFGDLDNDGRVEVIYQVSGVGILIFEWDGVAGSWNFGTSPSQIIDLASLAGTTNSGKVEYMEVRDVDGDGQNELLVAVNAPTNGNDAYYIISAVSGWETNSPGFSSFNLEKVFMRSDYGKWGLGGGSPNSMISANLDGQGNPEIILHNWNYKNVVPVRVPSADTYEISDTTNNKQNFKLTAYDNVALFSGVATDINGDGRDEVFLPTFSGKYQIGQLHMISYTQGQSTAEIDSSNVTLLNMSSVAGYNMFGIGYGDLDGNGKENIYIGGGLGHNIISAEFEGGNIKDTTNWKYSIIYPNTPDIYSAITYKDSNGVVDTVKTVNNAFVSKLYAKNTDLNNDGHQDIIMPYQGLNDSTTITHLKWNSSTTQYDTTSYKKIKNPKAWGIRVLEASTGTGIKATDMTIIMPKDFKLEQNYPNPFNPSTIIRFSLPVDKNISLTIYDILGRKIKTLIDNQEYHKGTYEARWDGTNNFGSKVASGIYIYTLRFGNFQKSLKMNLLK